MSAPLPLHTLPLPLPKHTVPVHALAQQAPPDTLGSETSPRANGCLLLADPGAAPWLAVTRRLHFATLLRPCPPLSPGPPHTRPTPSSPDHTASPGTRHAPRERAGAPARSGARPQASQPSLAGWANSSCRPAAARARPRPRPPWQRKAARRTRSRSGPLRAQARACPLCPPPRPARAPAAPGQPLTCCLLARAPWCCWAAPSRPHIVATSHAPADTNTRHPPTPRLIFCGSAAGSEQPQHVRAPLGPPKRWRDTLLPCVR